MCRRSWRNRIPNLEDYHASLGILHAKECKGTLSPLFLGSTVLNLLILHTHCRVTCYVIACDISIMRILVVTPYRPSICVACTTLLPVSLKW